MKSLNSLKIGIALTVGFATINGGAVPLIRSSSTNSTDNMVTIYPDNQLKDMFYYMPNTGRIALNASNKPLFGLTLYGLNENDPAKSGGWLTFTLEAGITNSLKNELKNLKASNQNAKFSVVPFGKSALTVGQDYMLNQTTELPTEAQALIPSPDKIAPSNFSNGSANNGLSSFFKSIYIPPSAGVAETQVGVNAVLTRDGAEVFRAAISNPQLMNMFLCYQVYGALPTMQAHVKMHYDKIYEYFSASAKGGWLWWGWSMNSVTEKLIEERAIEITITGGDAKLDDYIRLYSEELVKTYLVPKLTNAPNGSSYAPSGLILYGFNNSKKEERSTVEWNFTKQQFITDDRCVAIPLADLEQFKDLIIQEVKH